MRRAVSLQPEKMKMPQSKPCRNPKETRKGITVSHNPENNYKLILAGEKRFARRVIYQLRAQNPPPAWHNLIPFKFLFEYIRMRRAAQAFEQNAMVVRKCALDAAMDLVKGKSPAVVRETMQAAIRKWLEKNGFYSDAMMEKQMALAEAFGSHFESLLEAEGRDYETLVRQVYRIPPKYQEFLDKIAEMEKETDRLACEMSGPEENGFRKCMERMKSKQAAYAGARKIEIDRIYG